MSLGERDIWGVAIYGHRVGSDIAWFFRGVGDD